MSKKIISIFLCVCMLAGLLQISVSADTAPQISTVYRVGANHEYKTLSDVTEILKPGDTVFVDGAGAEYIGRTRFTKSGTAEAPIKIIGLDFNTGKPILRGDPESNLNVVEFRADHYIFENFEVVGNMKKYFPDLNPMEISETDREYYDANLSKVTARGLYQVGDGIVLRNCIVRECRNGIMGADQGSGSLTIEFCEIRQNGARMGDHNIYIACDEVRNPNAETIIRFNYSHHSSAGLALKTRTRRNFIAYNRFEYNQATAFDLLGPDLGSPVEDKGDVGQNKLDLMEIDPSYGEDYMREDSEFIGNIVIHNNGYQISRIGGDGGSGSIDRSGVSFGRFRFVNNTFIDLAELNDPSLPKEDEENLSLGIRLTHGMGSFEFYNNVVYSKNRIISLYAPNPAPEPGEEEATSSLRWNADEQVYGANNWINGNVTGIPEQFTGTITGTDPGFVDMANGDFNLKVSSPLVGAGTTETLKTFDKPCYISNIGGVRVEDYAYPNPTMLPEYIPVGRDNFRAPVRNNSDSVDIGAVPYAPGQQAVLLVGADKAYPNLQMISKLVQPGDLVLVDGDQEYPAMIDFQTHGTPAQPITIKGVKINGKMPKIYGVDTPSRNAVEFYGDNYVFDGFEIAGNLKKHFPGDVINHEKQGDGDYANNVTFRGISHRSNNLTIRNCVVHGCRQGLLSGGPNGAGSITLEYNEFYGNGIVHLTEHNLYLSTNPARYPDAVVRVQYNYIHSSNCGIGLKSRAQRTEIYYNWFENNYYEAMEIDAAPSGDQAAINEDSSFGEQYIREDADIVGNVIISNNNAHHVQVGGDMPNARGFGRYRLVNNLFYVNKPADAPIEKSNSLYGTFGLGSIEMYNNIVYSPKHPVAMFYMSEEVGSSEAVWQDAGRQVYGANNVVSSTVEDIAPEFENTIVNDNPGFIDEGKFDFRLLENSPLLGAGTSDTVKKFDKPLYYTNIKGVRVEDFQFRNPLLLPKFFPIHKNNFPVNNYMPVANTATGAADIGPYSTGAEKAFANGYPDGTFKPEGRITRAEVIQMLYNLVGGQTDRAVLDQFVDMSGAHWADGALAWAVSGGYLNGYDATTGKTLKPDEQIKRGELAAILNRIAADKGLRSQSGTQINLSDVENHWAYQAIMALTANGVTTGYPDGTFKPENPVNRAESVVMLSRLFGRGQTFGTAKTFSDLQSSHWAYAYIMNAVNGGK